MFKEKEALILTKRGGIGEFAHEKQAVTGVQTWNETKLDRTRRSDRLKKKNCGV